MRHQIVISLKNRVSAEIDTRSSIAFLKTTPVEDYVDYCISTVYLYTRPKRGHVNAAIFLTEIISAIGHGVRSKLKLKKDSFSAAKLGGFILYTFEELGYLQVTLGQGANGHGTYIVQVTNDEGICNLWNSLPTSQIEKLPSDTPFDSWVTHRHPTGASLVKTGSKEVLFSLAPEAQPIVFEALNKSQKVGWQINKSIYNLHGWALKNKTEAFADIWELSNLEARTTKLREARAIGDIAKKFLDKTFYHLYYYDFRGRKYPATAYLHEQGTDLAKGLLLRADKKAIGEEGFKWLLISIASNWAGDAGRDDGAKTDKIPLEDRILWSLENEELLLAYAESPKINQGWMKAEKPWQFLAACYELMWLRIHQGKLNNFEDYSYESSLECYIDGSNNGSQHLAALTLDEITAPHVNLVPQSLPGDLYKYVADHVWQRVESSLVDYSKSIIKDCENFIDNLIELKKQINATEPKSDLRKKLVEELKTFRENNKELLEISAPVFWSRIKDNKHRRKIVKRNVMTLPYGGTAYGLGEQQISDARKHNIELLLYMEHKWGAYLGREIFEDCRASLKRPMQLLSVFENAGKQAEKEGKFLKWTVPVTKFPVIQNYTEGKVKKVWVQYGPPKGLRLSTGYFSNTLQLMVCIIEDTVPSKGKQSQGASPNAIHSLDAAHLALTVYRADFPVTTIHDSFGSLLADMPKLFKLIRETFVELYSTDPLSSLMSDISGDISSVEIGNLDLNLVNQSEYCFV